MIPGQRRALCHRSLPRVLRPGKKAWFLLYLVTRSGADRICVQDPDPPHRRQRVAHQGVCYESFAAVHPAAGQPVGQGRTYRGPGQCRHSGGDEVYAREQATRDALRQALLASGASVSSIQRLENGSLRSEQIQIRSGGDIRQYRLKREEVRNGRMYITLVADIQAERQICQTQHYAKDLTLVRLRMRYPDQASTGALDDMPADLSRRLFETLATTPQVVARQWLDENLRIDPLHLQQGIAAPSRRSRP